MNSETLISYWNNTPYMDELPITHEVCWTEDLQRFFIVPVTASIGDGDDRIWGGTRQWVYVDVNDLESFEVPKRVAQRQGRTNNRRMLGFFVRRELRVLKRRLLTFGKRSND